MISFNFRRYRGGEEEKELGKANHSATFSIREKKKKEEGGRSRRGKRGKGHVTRLLAVRPRKGGTDIALQSLTLVEPRRKKKEKKRTTNHD